MRNMTISPVQNTLFVLLIGCCTTAQASNKVTEYIYSSTQTAPHQRAALNALTLHYSFTCNAPASLTTLKTLRQTTGFRALVGRSRSQLPLGLTAVNKILIDTNTELNCN